MKMVQVGDLQSGMVIAEPVLGEFDLVYAERGEAVTAKMLDRLDRLGIEFVYVEEDVQRPQEDVLQVHKFTTEYNRNFIECHENYNEIIGVMDHIFNDFAVIDKQIIETIAEPIGRLVENVTIDTTLLLKLKKLHSKDEYSMRHCLHVSMLSAMIAKWMGYSKDQVTAISLAGLLHDIGKSKIPDQVLNKPSRLDENEFRIMRRHSEIGYEMTHSMDALEKDVLRGIIEHHERVNGTGYPAGLKADQIHPYAKIVAVADIYDAMTTDRCYSKHRSPFEAVEEIKKLAFQGDLDAEVSAAFLKYIYRMFVGSYVLLNTGEIAEVVHINKVYPDSPIIRIGQEFVDMSRERGYSIVDIKF